MEIQGYNLPENLYYEKNHYWVKVEGDMLVMGMDDFAQQMAGDIEGNEALEADPSLINQDCYGKGWMYKIRPADMGELNNLIHDPADIEQWVLEDIENYKQD